MHARRIAVLCVMGLCSIAASAQMGGNANGSAPGTIATPAKAFDSQLSLIEEEMMGAVKAMPADQFWIRTKLRHLSPRSEDRV